MNGSFACAIMKRKHEYRCELTARLLTDAATQRHSYQALRDALYPMAASFDATVDEEVSVLVDSLVNLLEPLMVVILGLIVGFIVIALFMPLVKLLNDLS